MRMLRRNLLSLLAGGLTGAVVRGRPAAADGVAARRMYVDGPFGQLHVSDAGPKASMQHPPLICFHQSPVSGAQFAMFQREMAKTRRVLCPDTPGFGGSDAPPSPPTIEDYARAISDVLPQLGIAAGQVIDVLGYHTGTLIAAELALSRPKLVRKVVFSGLALFTPEELARNRAGGGEGPRPLADPAYIARYFAQQVVNGHAEISIPRRFELFVERLRSGDRSWYGPAAVFAYDTEQRLKSLAQPALLLAMSGSLGENTRRAASVLPQATLVARPDLDGQAAWDSHPQEIAAIVNAFLDAS